MDSFLLWLNIVSKIKVVEALALRPDKNTLTKHSIAFFVSRNEPPRDKTKKMTCAPSKDSDQSGQLSSLIRIFAVSSMGS